MTEIAVAAGWADFFASVSASSAALLGLLFVSLSINLERILKTAGLTSRASETMLLLAAALIMSLLALMPDRSTGQMGTPVLVVGALVWVWPMLSQIRGLRSGHHQPVMYEVGRFALRQLATVPLLVAGVLLLAGAANGLDWLAVGLMLCIVASLVTAWVLLVEILR